MEILKIPYINNTLGIELLSKNRPYALINGDDKIGVIDKEFLFIFNNQGLQKLYKYKEPHKKDYIVEFPRKAKEMKDFAIANLQVTKMFLENPKTCYPN